MRGAATIGISLLLVPLGAGAQPLPTFKATAQGSFMLPLALQNPVFNGLTSTMGQVDGAFNLPLYKGIGIGAGVNGTWYELNENALSPAVTAGTTDRLLAYGKLWWGRYTGPRTFFLVDAKLGAAPGIGSVPPAGRMNARRASIGRWTQATLCMPRTIWPSAYCWAIRRTHTTSAPG